MTQFRLSRLFPVKRRSHFERTPSTRRRGNANANVNANANANNTEDSVGAASNALPPMSGSMAIGRGRRLSYNRRASRRSSLRRASGRHSLQVAPAPENAQVRAGVRSSMPVKLPQHKQRTTVELSQPESSTAQQQSSLYSQPELSELSELSELTGHRAIEEYEQQHPILSTQTLQPILSTQTPQPSSLPKLSIQYSHPTSTSSPSPSPNLQQRRVSWQLLETSDVQARNNSVSPRSRLVPSPASLQIPMSYSPEHSPTLLTPAKSQGLQVEHMRSSSSSTDTAPAGADDDFTEALRQLSLSPRHPRDGKEVCRPHTTTLDSLLPEILESIFVHLPRPRGVARVCRLFNVIVSTSKAFKRRWLRHWLHPRLPDAFLPAYSDLCTAVEARKSFNVLIEIIDLMRLGRRALRSTTQNGSVTRLIDAAASHPDAHLLMPFMVDGGLQLNRYIRDHTAADYEATEGGSETERRSSKDYLTPVKLAAKSSKRFCTDLARSPTYFNDTELAFAIVLHERLDVAQALAMHQQHTLDVLAESVDRQYTAGMAWAFKRGVTPLQLQNPLYLRLCIEKADTKSASEIIDSDAAINISPSGHPGDPSVYSATSLLEFAIQCYVSYHEKDLRSARRRMIELFLERGADPNADGGRPLSLCVSNHDRELIWLLLNHGADPRVNDSIAVRIASDFGYKDLARTLHDISKEKNELDRRSSGHQRHWSAQDRMSQFYEPPPSDTVVDSDPADANKAGVKNKVRRWTMTTMRKIQTAGRRRYTESDTHAHGRTMSYA